MRKIVTRCFIGVMAVFMASIFLRAITQNILIEILHMDNGFTRAVFFDRPVHEEAVTNNINWAKLYPFQDNNAAKTNTVAVFKAKVFVIEEKIEKYTKDSLVNRILFVEFAVKYEIAIGWNLYETVYDLGDGWLTELVEKVEILPSKPEEECGDITTPAASLYDFTDFLADLGIDFLYVQSPHKISRDDTIPGASDFSNENADELLQALSARRIPYLDLRENVQQENLDHHSLFYKTDHHWKVETGLWAAGIIATCLNTNNGFNIDASLFNPARYRYDAYENTNLGSLGRKVTLVRAQAEDGVLIYPEFDTNLSILTLAGNIERQGTFDVIYKNKPLHKPDYYTSFYDREYSIINEAIHNNLLPDGKKMYPSI